MARDHEEKKPARSIVTGLTRATKKVVASILSRLGISDIVSELCGQIVEIKRQLDQLNQAVSKAKAHGEAIEKIYDRADAHAQGLKRQLEEARRLLTALPSVGDRVIVREGVRAKIVADPPMEPMDHSADNPPKSPHIRVNPPIQMGELAATTRVAASEESAPSKGDDDAKGFRPDDAVDLEMQPNHLG